MTSSAAEFAGLDLLPTAVVALDADLVVRYANPAAEDLFAIGERALRGQSFIALFAEHDALERSLRDATHTRWDYASQTVTCVRPGREPLPLSCVATGIELRDYALLVEVRPIEQQLRLVREERMVIEQQSSRELLRNLAHEIKNPLGGIRGAAQLLERELDRPPLIEYTQVIIGEADRLQSLVNRLLTPHRLPTYRRSNIHEILVRVKGVVQAEFPHVAFNLDFDASLPEFDADSEQLQQAALNIVRNAAQALSGTTADPRIRMMTRVARYVTLARRRHRLALALSIEDNGPGIPASIRDRIFYPLVSGREGGTGLGLTLAQTFIAQHGGTIECESRPGRTVFSILLPLELPRNASRT